ncbi:AcrR family transcriptional regulator [Nocardia transvalensis]|uniref:AcrR family transcriptional regulator n=1 Tax=Nocardia transvalensis TaxID=37333 RepID=A0A7W9PBA9_9NOCA|nr:TetR/AcrR family transcriptional regulator [Nocardia transvalensis]MBB5912533.1 AcrR family transcriptional regulator [Nocardia transvalensis]
MPTKALGHRRRPTQDRAKATREHILDTAAQLFGERGIANTSTNRIAAEAGVSIGTVYRYFSDRSVIVEELLGRLLENVERRFTQRVFGQADQPTVELVTGILEVIADELVDNARLVRALVAGVQFYSSGIPEFEPRLRLLVKVLLIQLLGPGDDHEYDVMTFVLINTGFAAVLRVSALDVDSRERQEALEMTARMIAAMAEAEIKSRAA